jgi:site-specific recombinase XerD
MGQWDKATERQRLSSVDKPLTAATKEDVRAYVAFMHASGLAPATMQHQTDSLRVLGDCFCLAGLTRASVPRSIVRRKLPNRLFKVISEKDVKRVIQDARTPREVALIEFAYATGLRVSELAHLRVENVNFQARVAFVHQGKLGDYIAIFGRPAAKALAAYLHGRETGPLFAPETHGKRVMRTVRLGDYELSTKERARLALDEFLERKNKLPDNISASTRSLSSRQLYRIIVKVAQRAGIKLHPHMLRHSMATHCLNRGMDLVSVSALLGHSSIVGTQKYLQLATTDLERVHRKAFGGTR